MLTGRDCGRVSHPVGVKASIVFCQDVELIWPPVTKSLLDVIRLGETEIAANVLADIIAGDENHSLSFKE